MLNIEIVYMIVFYLVFLKDLYWGLFSQSIFILGCTTIYLSAESLELALSSLEDDLAKLCNLFENNRLVVNWKKK